MDLIETSYATQTTLYGFTHKQVQSACDEINESQISVKLQAYTYELRGLCPTIVTTIAEYPMVSAIPQEIIDATLLDRKRNLWVVIYRNGESYFNWPARLLLEKYHHEDGYCFPAIRYGSDHKPTLVI